MIRAYAVLAGCYLASFFTGWACFTFLHLPVLLESLVADIAATIVVFLFSWRFNNASLYDPYWSVAPPVLAAIWMLPEISGGASLFRFHAPETILFVCVLVWSVRLTLNWFRRWNGLTDVDWRYRSLQDKTGSWFPFVNLAGIHLFPTLMVFAGMLPVYYTLQLDLERIHPGIVAAAAVCLAGVFLEWLADNELRRFIISEKETPFLKTGVWKHIRHPNYLGEVLFWWGLALFAIAADRQLWWTSAGAWLITFMFVFISIPMMDQRLLGRKPGYAEWMRETPSLFPRLK